MQRGFLKQEQLSRLERLDFTGNGEAFVESRFITPLLALFAYCLKNPHCKAFRANPYQYV
jgi:hypothetical protein